MPGVRIGHLRLHLGQRRLLRGDEPVRLGSRALDILCVLAEARGSSVSKDELMARVWPGVVVEENNLHVHISALRKALDEGQGAESRIVTIPGRGYRLTLDDDETAPSPSIVAEAALTAKPSIAVLPFQNMGGDPEQEYFAEGMVEEIITALSKLRWFFVIARNSAFAYKGRHVDIKRVGADLGVRYVVEGSVRRAGERLRVAAQLIEVATENHLWAERYDRKLADIFAVQDEITARIAGAIEPELYAAEHIRSRRQLPESLSAWECVIRALASLGRGTRESIAEAEALCRRAIVLAPSYAQAHSILASALMRRSFVLEDFETLLPEIRREVQTAISLDERDPWAYTIQGAALHRMQRFAESERAIAHALEINPNFAVAYAYHGLPLSQLGKLDAAIRSAEHAMRLSPHDQLVTTTARLAMALAYTGAGRFEDCTVTARIMVEAHPDDIRGYIFLVASLAMLGDSAGAGEAREAMLRLRPDFTTAWWRRTFAPAGETRERLVEGFRRAGLPEQ